MAMPGCMGMPFAIIMPGCMLIGAGTMPAQHTSSSKPLTLAVYARCTHLQAQDFHKCVLLQFLKLA